MKRTHPCTALLIALALAATCGGTAGAAVPAADWGLDLPEYIGELEFIGERSPPQGRNGVRYTYRAVGRALEIGVYDFGVDALPDGPDSAVLARQLERARAAWLATSGAVLREDRRVPLGADGSIAVREVVIGRDASGGASGYLWLTARHGLLVEGRLEVEPGFEEDAWVDRSDILSVLAEALPRSPEPVERARAAARRDAERRVAIVWDADTPEDERAAWMAYLLSRAAHAGRRAAGDADASGEGAPSFDDEVAARLLAVKMYRRTTAPDAAGSGYFADLDRVEKAGFLREYVWHFLRRDDWSAPEGLDLAGFDRWRAVHLPDHEPATRGRIALRIAAQ